MPPLLEQDYNFPKLLSARQSRSIGFISASHHYTGRLELHRHSPHTSVIGLAFLLTGKLVSTTEEDTGLMYAILEILMS